VLRSSTLTTLITTGGFSDDQVVGRLEILAV